MILHLFISFIVLLPAVSFGKNMETGAGNYSFETIKQLTGNSISVTYVAERLDEKLKIELTDRDGKLSLDLYNAEGKLETTCTDATHLPPAIENLVKNYKLVIDVIDRYKNGEKSSFETKKNTLEQYSPSGARVLEKAGSDLSKFKFFSRDSDLINGLESGIHETVHTIDIYENSAQQYYLIDGTTVSVPAATTLPISAILSELPVRAAQSESAQEYLKSDIGTQSIHSLLDELNAYAHGGRVTVDLGIGLKKSLKEPPTVVSGLQYMMLFVETYIDVAHKTAPDTYQKITGKDFKEAISKIWTQSEKVLSDACSTSAVKISKTLIQDVYTSPYLSEIEAVVGHKLSLPNGC